MKRSWFGFLYKFSPDSALRTFTQDKATSSVSQLGKPQVKTDAFQAAEQVMSTSVIENLHAAQSSDCME